MFLSDVRACFVSIRFDAEELYANRNTCSEMTYVHSRMLSACRTQKGKQRSHRKNRLLKNNGRNRDNKYRKKQKPKTKNRKKRERNKTKTESRKNIKHTLIVERSIKGIFVKFRKANKDRQTGE